MLDAMVSIWSFFLVDRILCTYCIILCERPCTLSLLLRAASPAPPAHGVQPHSSPKVLFYKY